MTHGVAWGDDLVFFLVVLYQVSTRGLRSGLGHVLGMAGGRVAGTVDLPHLVVHNKHTGTSNCRGRIWPAAHNSTQPVARRGAHVNPLRSQDLPVGQAQRRAQPGKEVGLHLPVQEHSGELVSAGRGLTDKPAQATECI